MNNSSEASISLNISLSFMGAGRTGQGVALAPPWNFKFIIIIAYKCNMYYL